MADVYVNIQGDEPLVTCGHIETLVRPFLSEAEVQVTTLKIRATPDEAVSPTVNKVVTNAHGDALYFSKHAIPYDRDKRGVTYWKHIGLYAYRRPVLDVFHRLPPSTLERAEGLEQLRLLEEGIPIRVLETDRAHRGRGHGGGSPGRRGRARAPRPLTDRRRHPVAPSPVALSSASGQWAAP